MDTPRIALNATTTSEAINCPDTPRHPQSRPGSQRPPLARSLDRRTATPRPLVPLSPIILLPHTRPRPPGPMIGGSAITPDPACGPANLFLDHASCGWRPRSLAARSYVELTVQISETHNGSRASPVLLDPAASLKALEVRTSSSDPAPPTPDWEVDRYCVARSPAADLTCRFLSHDVRTVQIRFVELQGGIRGLSWD